MRGVQLFQGSTRVLASFVVLVAVAAAAEKERTWTDVTGENQIEARFLSQDGTKVMLKGANGRTYRIAIDQLSPEDRDYLKTLKENPFQEVSPFEEVDPPAEDGESSPPAEPVDVDWSGAELLTIQAPEDGWQYQRAGESASRSKLKNVALPKSNDGEWLKAFFVSADSQKGVLSYQAGNPISGGTTRLAVVSFSSGRIIGETSAEGSFLALAISDDGNRILVRSDEFGFGKKGKLTMVEVGRKEFQQRAALVPHEEMREADQNIVWADFVGEGHFALLAEGGRCSFWDADRVQPVCYFDLGRTAACATSPDGKVVAFADDSQVGLFDVANQTFLGVGSMPDGVLPRQLAFSPSGERLACIGSGHAVVWNTSDGTTVADLPLTGLVELSVQFVQENYLLVSSKYLIDLDNQLKLWTYNGPQQAATIGDTTLMAIQWPGQAGAILAASLPHPEALELLEAAKSQPDLFLMKPGGTVSLDVSKIPSGHQNEVRDQLTAKLQELNIGVQEGSLSTLVASVEEPKPRIVNYGRFFGGFGGKPYTVQEIVSQVQVIWEGRTAWSKKGSNVPGSVRLDGEKGIKQILKEKTAQPNLKFFETVQLPSLVQKPSGDEKSFGQTLGQTTITARGIR